MSSSSSAALAALLFALAAADGARTAAAQDSSRADSAEEKSAKPKKPAKLFVSDSIFPITIGADIKKFMATRDSSTPSMPAWLVVGHDTLRIGIKPRGHFRRKASTCAFPPVSVKFEKGEGKGTPFAKQKKLKLVTTCWPGNAEYDRYVALEYLIYRAYSLITPFSFRARFVRVTYVDTAHTDRAPVAALGFFIEDEKEMAARNGGTVLDIKGAATKDDFDAETLARMSLLEYMIGNTDLSFGERHNTRLVRTGDFGVVFPVGYDFDWSGVVNARYAVPDKSLPIRTVRYRLWMSYCLTPQELTPAVAVFNERKQAIYDLYTETRLLDPEAAKSATSYYDDFFSIINDPKRLSKEIQRHCAG